MKVIVLAAGFATRLRPLTSTIPKALLPLADKPILNYTLNPLIPLLPGVSWSLVTNHTYINQFNSWKQKYYNSLGLTIFDNQVVDSDHRLGAIGDLVFALNQTHWQDDLLVLASDTLTSLDWSKFLSFIQLHPTSPATVVCPTNDLSLIQNKLGCAIIKDDQLESFVEKPSNPPSNLRAVPFYYFPRAVISKIVDYYQSGNSADSPGSILPYLLKVISIYAFNLGGNGYYHDVGTLEVYQSLQLHPPKLL
ncbi:MAG: sugar phosphate nucleotidyltransferase [bacterium]